MVYGAYGQVRLQFDAASDHEVRCATSTTCHADIPNHTDFGRFRFFANYICRTKGLQASMRFYRMNVAFED
jgi:hypothetical protein